MQGFHTLLCAMVLQPVESLSDDGAANDAASSANPVTKSVDPKKPDSKKNQPPKQTKPPKTAKSPKEKPVSKKGKNPMKKPAAAQTAEKDTQEPCPEPMKKPAASSSEIFKVGKCQYKNGKYGFKFNGRESYSVT